MAHCLLSEPSKIVFGDDSGIDLLVSCSLFFLSSLILYLSPIYLLLASLLSGFVPLSDNQLGIDNLFVFLLLALHDFELGFLEDFHSGLLQGLATENVQHWLNLFVEVEKLVVSLEDLSCLAAVLRGHFRGEEGHWGPVQIELSGDALLPLWWLISKDLLVGVSLNIHVEAAWDWLRSWDITVWVDVPSLFRCLKIHKRLNVTYTSLFKSPWLWLALIHHHLVWISASRDDHCSVGASSLNSPVMHDILREVFSVKKDGWLVMCQPFLFSNFKFQARNLKLIRR